MNYHFIGIGGIGMSALARLLLQKGHRVQGSDIRSSALLDQLHEEGAKIRIGHGEDFVPLDATVVYSTGIHSENVELQRAKALQLRMLHRSDLLHQLTEGQKTLLVTGTHGKTTTTALLATVLSESGLDPTFVVGGILRSCNSNASSGKGVYFVAEADESDGSFLKTPSFGAIVTNLEKEHLDYWKTEEELSRAFQTFFLQVQKPEHLFWCADDAGLMALHPPGNSYGFSDQAMCRISKFNQTQEGICFDLVMGARKYRRIELSLLGRHNALNGSAVFCLALSLGIEETVIRSAFKKFSGTCRRLEKVGEVQKIQVYDDYGHHPTEIAATLSALREHIRERRLIVLFQPHRYSRTRDLMEEFFHCFSEVDELILTDIYAAGENPIEGISSQTLCAGLRARLGRRVHVFPKAGLEESVAGLARPGDVILTLGAGDITGVGKVLLKKISEKSPMLTVGVLFGGTSAEHEISLRSARNILCALDSSLYRVKSFGLTRDGVWAVGDGAMDFVKYHRPGVFGEDRTKMSPEVLAELNRCDVCIPVFHGPQGEDGMVQGLLDTLSIPYVGCDYRSGSVCMHKAWTKHVALIHGVPTAPYLEFDAVGFRRNRSHFFEEVERTFSYPVWVKPAHLGSSIGVSRVMSRDELEKAIQLCFQYDECLIVEREVNGRQIEFAVLGNEYIRVGAPGEILDHGEFYDYEKKYGAKAMQTQTPADLTESEEEIGKELARRMYEACGCKGLARIDFFLDRNGHYWLNEINPFPGFTETSLYPKMWEVNGLTQRELCDELLILARQRHRRLLEIRGGK